MTSNLHRDTVAGFGEEWHRFDQSVLESAEQSAMFNAYFRDFPWNLLPPEPRGMDVGCGSGRWAMLVAPRVKWLLCVDASAAALAVAARNLKDHDNVELVQASVDSLPVPPGSLDFGYSLGVLHHIPDPRAGLCACVSKLKRGAPFLLYLYYDFDNRPAWFRRVWRVSDALRRRISRLPTRSRQWIADAIAVLVYWPLARTAKLLAMMGIPLGSFPLAAYRDRSFYTMRTDALDRFGTALEHRFTRSEIAAMMGEAGLTDIHFCSNEPYWVAYGLKA